MQNTTLDVGYFVNFLQIVCLNNKKKFCRDMCGGFFTKIFIKIIFVFI